MSSIISMNELNNQSLPYVSVHQLHDESHMKVLEQKIDEAERHHQSTFQHFNDLDMIYYFVHIRKDQNQKGNRSENTKNEYLRELLQLAKLLIEYRADIGLDFPSFEEGTLFKNLQPRHLRRFQSWYAEQYPYIIGRNSVFSPATLSRKTAIWRMFLRFLYDQGYTTHDLTSRMQTYSVQKADRPNKDLAPSEVFELLDHFSEVDPHPIYFSLIHIFVTTGIRNSELCKLKVGDVSYDVDREQYFLYIRGKGNKKRHIPLRGKTMESIVKFREARLLAALDKTPDNEPLLPTATGKAYSPSYLSQLLSKAVRRVNLKRYKKIGDDSDSQDKDEQIATITPHTFRHAFAILSYDQGVDVYTIQRSLGRENIKTTEVYLEKEYGKDQFATLEWHKGVIQKYI
ncbi:tyrosine-type recombinase/integrase [Piscibacillus sp. B03]|uniref:tyrosine-type recombinase/integrase n=1 Tax=Piscibacillus sp. B03 TaxID=3457430 RepID=UPI003FCD6F2D